MAGRAAPVLVALVSEIALVRIGVGEVPGRRVMHHGLGDLAEGGHQAMDEQEDEQEAHGGRRCYVRFDPEARSVAGRAATRRRIMFRLPRAGGPDRRRTPPRGDAMTDRSNSWRRSTGAGAVLLAALVGCSNPKDAISQAAKTEKAKPGLEEVKAIAEEGFVYGLPIVMNYGVMVESAVDRNSGQFKAPFNEIHNEARVFTYKDTSVVTPNSDTPYSLAFLDLRAEPFVLSVPAVPASRYYSVQLVDGNTFNYGYVGTRTTGPGPGDFLVAGPGWKGEKPPGIRGVFRSSTQFSLALFRTQLFHPGDMENVKRIQAGYQVKPLSSFLGQPAPAAAPAVTFPRFEKDLVKTEFFTFLDFALQFAPPAAEEDAIRARLARIGVGPGKTFDFKDLSLEHRAAVALGMKEGRAKVEQKVPDIGRRVNGWQVGSAFGDRDFFHGDWLLRAAAATAGIYGNDAAEAMYPMTTRDASGEPLDGSKHDYTVTFAPGQFPPVKAFWSVTMYDGKTQLLVENPIGRYLVNSPMLPSLKKGPGGSVTLYLQKSSPGKAKESNWLPAPDGPIYLVMRLYWPRTEPPSILPPGEGSWSPPPVVRTR